MWQDYLLAFLGTAALLFVPFLGHLAYTEWRRRRRLASSLSQRWSLYSPDSPDTLDDVPPSQRGAR